MYNSMMASAIVREDTDLWKIMVALLEVKRLMKQGYCHQLMEKS